MALLPLLGRRTFKRIRPGAGAFDGTGKWVAGLPTLTNISGALQPLERDDVERLPEGERADNWRILLTEDEVLAPDQHAATDGDTIQDLKTGLVYNVAKVDPFIDDDDPLAHNEVWLVRVAEARKT